MKAVWNGKTIAETNETIEIEGNQYFPPDSVDKDLLRVSEGYHTTCPWKGQASYYDIVIDGETNEKGAWFYPKPNQSAIDRVGENFTNYVAFWNGVSVVQ